MKQRHLPWKIGMLFGCAVALVASSMSPAAAAPPQNDDIGSPVVIDSLPYGTVQSTVEASPSEGDPFCLDQRTVW